MLISTREPDHEAVLSIKSRKKLKREKGMFSSRVCYLSYPIQPCRIVLPNLKYRHHSVQSATFFHYLSFFFLPDAIFDHSFFRTPLPCMHLSEAYRDHPLNLHHIIPIDFSSSPTVPDSHTWPQSDGFFHGPLRSDEQQPSIPTIDLTAPNAAELLGQACESWGVFHLVNHGVPLTLLEETEIEAQRFFSLPASQKLKALRTAGGATGYGIARISPFFSKYMWHEGFTIIGSPIDHVRDIWPTDSQRFCHVLEEYQKKMKGVAERMCRMIMNYLEISEAEVTKWVCSKNDACTALQLNSYPPCPDPNRAIGLAPHTDTFLLTILHQTLIQGLQILKEGVGWVPLSPTAGALVVNVGDLLHILSNARFPSLVHRVAVNGSSHRLSVAYFYGPPTDFCVSPFCTRAVGSTPPMAPLYRSVTVKDYVRLKAEKLDKALSLITI